MNDQQQTTGGVEQSSEQRGLDRRRFLLGTTAVTAGAWAAPSIFTIDRAFGAHTGTPCPCDGRRKAVSVLATGHIAGNDINQVQCPEEGQDYAIGSLGTVDVADAECADCTAYVKLADVALTIQGQPVSAEALTSDVRCCPDGSSSGHTSVLNFQFGSIAYSGSDPMHYELPLNGGEVWLNEHTASGEFNAVHIVIPDGGDVIDIKLASSRCVNGTSA